MKMRTIMASAMAALMLSACSKEEAGYNVTSDDSADVAYLSLRIATDDLTKSSTEQDVPAENTLSSLYLVVFDKDQNVLKVPGESEYYVAIPTGATVTPDAFRISASAERLLVVANPGSSLKGAITGLAAGSTYNTLNKAIENISLTECFNSNNFTMINSGDDTGKNTDDKITDPLIVLDPDIDIKKVSDYNTEAEAKADAEVSANRVTVNIERLASKLYFAEKTGGADAPSGASFTLGTWTVDALNTAYYPYAEKTILEVAHNSGTFYNKNFYTKDPNFDGAVGAGISYTKIESDFTPTLIHPDGWKATATTAYTIENTMAAKEQKYGNATRLVIKGTYYPDDTWTGDWFSFAYVNYENLAALKTAYDEPDALNLQAACDDMFDKIKDYLDNQTSYTLTATKFEELSTTDLAAITDNLGGEVIKTKGSAGTPADPCIRWYQNGQNYYYYEIRHDNSAKATATEMAFGKYGVVRNNWYSLTLTEVSGAGTPWYPDINEPGPGDPDPTDPIDEAAGYLGIEVKTAPWIFWETNVKI